MPSSDSEPSNVVRLATSRDTILTKKQLAAHLGCSTRTIENKMRDGMPALSVDRFGRRRFKLGDVETWLDTSARVARSPSLSDRVASLEAEVNRLKGLNEQRG
jgi:phage terminase Nu1 subunit (DNA packaging protein)